MAAQEKQGPEKPRPKMTFRRALPQPKLKTASKRRNTSYQNKKHETTESVLPGRVWEDVREGCDLEDLAAIKDARSCTTLVLATNAKNILLLGYGTTLGFPTIVIPSVSAFNLHQAANATGDLPVDDRLRDTLSLTLDQISWFSSINLLCVPIGCVLSGLVTQPLGRKPSMLALNVPFVCAWLIYRWCASVGTLYAALAITGLTGGLLEAPVLTYVAEITEPEVRGLLAAMSSMCVILGIFVQFLLGTLLHWRTIALINISIPVCALIAISFVPESPYWLIGRGRLEEAEKSLMWLRGWVDREEVQEELADLKETIREDTEEERADVDDSQADGRAAPWWRPYAKKSFLHPFALVTLAFAIGHFGGMTTLQTFAVGIFTAVGSPLDKYVSTLALGLTQLLGALFCMATVKFTGKRPLAMVSTGGAGLCFLVVALYSRVTPAGTALETSAVAWLPLVGLLTATFGTHIAIRLLPWMLIGEVYTPETRAAASGLSAGMGYVLGFAANKSYLYLVRLLGGVWAVLLLDAIVSLLGAVLLYFLLPETEGITLHEVQQHFKNKKKRQEKARWASSNPALDTGESRF